MSIVVTNKHVNETKGVDSALRQQPMFGLYHEHGIA
jgi:hypothetical protein